MREFSDWHMHPILNVDSDPLLLREVGLATLRDQRGLAAGRIAKLRRYTARQLAEIYGFGATGAALGRVPKTQAVWNRSTHPRPPPCRFGGPRDLKLRSEVVWGAGSGFIQVHGSEGRH